MFAIDYDGVIANTNLMKSRWIQERLGLDVPPFLCDRTDCVPLIGEPAYSAMGDYVYGYEGTMAAPPVPGVEEGVRALAERGPLYLLTARPPTRLEFAREWLEKSKLAAYFEELSSAADSSKLAIAAAKGCRVMIDDDVRHLVAGHPQVYGVLLKIGMPAPGSMMPRIEFADSWEDAARAAQALSRKNEDHLNNPRRS